MQLALLVPGMLAIAAERLAAMPALERLACYAAPPRAEPRGIAAALFVLLGLDADTPVAPLAMLGAAGDPRDDYVLCADPVHLAADRDTVLLVQRVDDLSADAQVRLVRMLDGHFASDGLRFEALRPDAWFARCHDAPDVRMTPLDAALRRPLFPHLPAGADARRWRTWQNEIQMLLHEHPVNAEREAHGQPTVTGLWFWGGGALRAVGDVQVGFVAAAAAAPGDLVRGLAQNCGVTARRVHDGDDLAHALDGSAASPSTHAASAYAVVVAPPKLSPQRLESAWLAPALARLARGDVEALHLIADGHGGAGTWSAARPTWWRRIAARAAQHRFDVPHAA
jgi:hypothetical protein